MWLTASHESFRTCTRRCWHDMAKHVTHLSILTYRLSLHIALFSFYQSAMRRTHSHMHGNKNKIVRLNQLLPLRCPAARNRLSIGHTHAFQSNTLKIVSSAKQYDVNLMKSQNEPAIDTERIANQFRRLYQSGTLLVPRLTIEIGHDNAIRRSIKIVSDWQPWKCWREMCPDCGDVDKQELNVGANAWNENSSPQNIYWVYVCDVRWAGVPAMKIVRGLHVLSIEL